MKTKNLLIITNLIFFIFYVYVNSFTNLKIITLFLNLGINVYFIIKDNLNLKLNKIEVFSSLFISIFLFSISFNPTIGYYKKNVTIQNLSAETIKISAIYKNGSKVSLNKRVKDDNSEDYKIYNKKTEKYVLYLKPQENYKLRINKENNVIVNIEKGNLEQTIKVDNEQIIIPTKSLNTTSIQESLINNNYQVNIDTTNKNMNVFLILRFIIMIIYVFMTAMYIIKLFTIKRYSLIMLLLFPFLFLLNSKISIDSFVTLFSLIIIVLISFLDHKIETDKINKKSKLLILVLSIILTLSVFGYFFLNTKFNYEILALIITSITYFNILLNLLFNFVNVLKGKIRVNENEKIKINHLVFFMITFIMACVYLYTFYPYILTKDGAMQLQEVMTLKFTDWHPYFSTYLYSLIYHVFYSATSIIVIRIFLYSILVSSILSYCHKKGINVVVLYLIAFLSIFPVNGLFLVTFWKDVDFTIAIISLIYFLYLLLFDNDYFECTLFHYLAFFVSILCVGFFRHNGIVIFLILLLIIFIYSIKKKQILLLITSILLVISSIFIKIPLYNILEVEPAPKNFAYATMLHGLQREYVNDNVPLETKKWMETILSNKQWVDSYNPSNIDSLLHYSGKNVRNMNIDKNLLFKYYFIQLKNDPFGIIKDRFDGTYIIWSMFSNDNVEDYKYHIIYDDLGTEYYSNYGVTFSTKKITTIFQKIMLFIAENSILDIIFLRGGLALCILLSFIIYNVIHNEKRWIFVLLPVLLNILTLFLTMHHQSFRYVWNINLGVCLVILLWIVSQKNLKNA